jgi:hypothetical protein
MKWRLAQIQKSRARVDRCWIGWEPSSLSQKEFLSEKNAFLNLEIGTALSVCVPVNVSVCLCRRVFVYLLQFKKACLVWHVVIYVPTYVHVCLSVCFNFKGHELSVRLSVNLSFCLCTFLFAEQILIIKKHSLVCLPMCLGICLSMQACVRLSVVIWKGLSCLAYVYLCIHQCTRLFICTP